MTFFKKSWKKYILILLVVSFSLGAYLIITAQQKQHQMEQIAQNDTGICIKEGRVLTEAEHRQAFLRNLLQFDINNIKLMTSAGFGFDKHIGVIRNTIDSDFPKLLDEFFNNGKSFEENFKIDMIYSYPNIKGIDIDDLKEPFILVGYDYRDYGIFTASKNIAQIGDLKSEELKHSHLSLDERYQGFGNHYYKIISKGIKVACCDKQRHPMTEENYIAAKNAAYLDSTRMILEEIVEIVAVSNCGELLTKPMDNGLGGLNFKYW